MTLTPLGVFAVTIMVYFSYYLFVRYYNNKKLELFFKKTLSAATYTILLLLLLNTDYVATKAGLSTNLMNASEAIKNIDTLSNTMLTNIGIISDIALFIAIFDVIISITSVVIPGAGIALLSAYRPYTHMVLSYMEGIAKILGYILILLFILRDLLGFFKNIKPLLALLSSLIIPSETRKLGKGFLAAYIVFLVILPVSVNISLQNIQSVTPDIHHLLPIDASSLQLSNLTIRLRTYDQLAFPGYGVLKLDGQSITLVTTIFDGKNIILPEGTYKSTSLCIYWHNFSNSACCFKKGYSECYGCYVTPIINTSNTKYVNISIPFHAIPCNNSRGIAGLYRSEEKPIIERGKIVFLLTPTNRKITVKIIGGGFKINAYNNTGWTVYYKVTSIGKYIRECDASLDEYQKETTKWRSRVNLQLYANWTPSLGERKGSNEYTLTVWAAGNVSANNCTNRVIANVTIYGSGCWNPNIAYLNYWKIIDNIERYIQAKSSGFTNYVISTLRLLINTYTIFILSSSVILIALNTIWIPFSTLKKSILSLERKLISLRINLFSVFPKKKVLSDSKDETTEQSKNIKNIVLWPLNQKIIIYTKATSEKIKDNIEKYKQRKYAEDILKNIHQGYTFTVSPLDIVLFLFKTNYVLNTLPTDAKIVLAKYLREPYLPVPPADISRKIFYEEAPRSLLMYISAKKYNKNIGFTINYLFELRKKILQELSYSSSDSFYSLFSPEERYRSYIDRGLLPDLDYMILSLLSNTSLKELVKEGQLSFSRLNEIVSSVIKTYSISNYYERIYGDKNEKP